MLTDLPPALLGTLGAGGLLSVAVLLILTGRLIPRAVVEDIREELELTRAENRELRAQNVALQQTTQLALALAPRQVEKGRGDPS